MNGKKLLKGKRAEEEGNCDILLLILHFSLMKVQHATRKNKQGTQLARKKVLKKDQKGLVKMITNIVGRIVEVVLR